MPTQEQVQTGVQRDLAGWLERLAARLELAPTVDDLNSCVVPAVIRELCEQAAIMRGDPHPFSPQNEIPRSCRRCGRLASHPVHGGQPPLSALTVDACPDWRVYDGDGVRADALRSRELDGGAAA